MNEIKIFEPENQDLKELLSNSTVKSKLTEIEKQISRTWIEKRLSSYSKQQLSADFGKLIRFIAKDSGIIQPPDQYDQTRFVEILLTYYRDFSINEVKMAFELANVGELDSFLLKDRDGNPDKNHYQVFSVEYVCKILNAYKKRKSQIHFKALKALPEKAYSMTEQEKQEVDLSVRHSIAEKFIRYRDEKVIPVFYVHVAIFSVLRDAGIITETEFQTSKESVEEALKQILSDRTVAESERSRAKKYVQNGSISSILQNRAGMVEYDKQIIRIFDKLIVEKTDIYKALSLTNG